MKIIINDELKEEIYNTDDNLEKNVLDIISRELPGLYIGNIKFDYDSKQVLYIDKDAGINLVLGRISDKEEPILLTITEIRSLIRNGKLKINEEVVSTEDIAEEVKSAHHEPSDKVLELHTHFVEVLDGEKFFRILVENDESFIDKENEGKYIVSGKSYTREELIKALEYPLEHISGTEKKEGTVKTLAFSKLSQAIALRTQILKGDGREKSRKTISEIEHNDKFILVSRIRKLFIASIEKLEREGVNYVELSYSRTDIDDIFNPPEEVLEPKMPVKEECDNYEEALEKYNQELSIYNRYLEEYEDYKEFMNQLNEIEQRGKIEYKFLISTQRDSWHDESLHGTYIIPKNSIGIIKEFLSKWNNISDEEKEKILEELKINIDIKDFKDKIIFRITSLEKQMGTKRVDSIINRINTEINSIEDIIKFIKKGNTDKTDGIILYNILFENLDFIRTISDKYPDKFDMTGMVPTPKQMTVVGYDIMGYETRMTNAERFFLEEKILSILKGYNPEIDPKAVHSGKRVIRIHAGETRESSGNVLEILRIIKKIKDDSKYKDIFDDFEFRIGHGVFIFDEESKADEVVKLLVELGVIVEVNLSSNYALDNVDEITDVPIKVFRKGKVRYVVSTDGGGVYKTTIMQEGLLEHRYFKDDEPKEPKKFDFSESPETEPPEDIEDQKLSELIYNDSVKFDVEVVNEFKDLIYIFYKDFSIDNILNYNEIITLINRIDKDISNGKYAQAKLRIISCKVLMNYPVDSNELIKSMDNRIKKARSRLSKIIDSEEIQINKELHKTLLLISKMSDKDFIIHYDTIFEKYDLNKLLKLISNGKAFNNKENLLKFNNDIHEIFSQSIKNKFADYDIEELKFASNILLIKDEDDKSKHIDYIIELIKLLKKSKSKNPKSLEDYLSKIDIEQLRINLESDSVDNINDWIKRNLLSEKNTNELSYILSRCYEISVKSGSDITVEEFMKGDEHVRQIKR